MRFANNVVQAQEPLAKVLVDGLGKESSLNAIQNLSILAMAVSQIPPAQFYQLAFGLKDAMSAMTAQSRQSDENDAPGVTGAYRMLKDDELWAALSPVLEAIKAFSQRMGEEPDKPITQFTGKPTDN